jgi:hypothetical protein
LFRNDDRSLRADYLKLYLPNANVRVRNGNRLSFLAFKHPDNSPNAKRLRRPQAAMLAVASTGD